MVIMPWADGSLRLFRANVPVGEGFGVGWEPRCPKCGKPIQWVLDMFSFTPQEGGPGYALEHARCAWTPGAFDRERLAAERQNSVKTDS
jgi:hypothetical protein